MRPNSRNAGNRFCSASWTVLARRRDLRQNQRTLDLALYRAVDKEEEPSTSCCAPSATSPRPKPSSGLLSGVRADCRLKSRSTVIRPHIAQPKRPWTKHPEGNQCKIRSSKYLNNLIEQDHRSSRFGSVLCSASSISAKPQRRSAGIELMHRIRKGQFNLGRLGAQGQHGSQDLECGSRCVIQRNFLGACLARPQNVCTTTARITARRASAGGRYPNARQTRCRQICRDGLC